MLNLKKYTINSLDVLFLIFLVKETLWSYFRIILSKIPIIGVISKELTILIIVGLIILSIPHIVKQLKPVDYIIYAVFCVIYLIQYIIFPENSNYLDEKFTTFFCNSLPIYFIGRTIDYNKLSKIITLLSILSILAITYTSFYYKGGDDFDANYGGYHMAISFRLLPFLLLVLLDAFKNKSIISALICIYGFVLLLSLGNRGCIIYSSLCLFYFIIYSLRDKFNFKRVITLTFCFCLFVYLSYNFLLDKLYDLIVSKGLTTRIFIIIEENRFFEDSGRFGIFNSIFSSLSTNFLGLGLFGDRVLTSMYSHNIFIEILSSFGYLIGTLFIIILLILFFKAYKYSMPNNHLLFISVIGFGILPLMTSHSFIEYPYFYFLLGYVIKVIFDKREKNISKI